MSDADLGNWIYAYNTSGQLTRQTDARDQTSCLYYDDLGRMRGRVPRSDESCAATVADADLASSYSYDAANRLTSFNGQTYNYYDSGPYHAVDRIGDFDRFDYDANGNMVKRNKGLSDQQTLVWDAENRLSQVQDNNGDLVEQYWYDVDGARVKKVSGSTTTYTFFAQYEEEVTYGVTTVVSYYTFGSMRVAVKRGSTLYHLHGDHLGSTSLTTAGSTVEASRAYYAYGAERSASGDLKTDRTFTGQKRDATGLMYYNARYYDPALGTFISPDSMVPGAGQMINYNRFLYARGNPLKYSDPTGYSSQEEYECSTRECREEKWYWNNRWYEARGFGYNPEIDHWDWPIPNRFADIQIWADYVGKLAEDLQEDPSRLNWQDWTHEGRIHAAVEIYRRLPEGATSVGVMGDAGIGADFLGDIGAFFDKSGNFAFGASIGFGGMTGINVDAAGYLQSFPWADSIDVFHGDTLNVGLSGKFLQGFGLEGNLTREEGKWLPTIGGTVYYVFAGVGINLPLPPVEFYGNLTHTWLTPRFNILRFILGLPQSNTR